MFFTPAFEEGGGERLYVNLLKDLPHSEVEMTLACWKIHPSHFVSELPDYIQVYDLGHSGRFRRELPRLIRETRRLINAERPDIVMAISTEVNWALWLACAFARHRPPIILNEQGSPSGWLTLLRGTNPARAALVTLGYRLLHKRWAARVVCVSEAVRRDLIDTFGSRASHLVTIPNPLDISAVRRAANETVADRALEGDAPIIVSAGRFFFQKGYDVLIRAFAMVARESDARLVIVGDGPERPALERLIDELDIKERCFLVGYRDNPFPFVARGTVFALPSRTEGFGYVLVEAMALGVPVVTTDAAGPAEIVDHGQFGEVVPVDDQDALSRALLELLGDEDRRHRLVEAAHTRVEEYSSDRIVRTYLDLFESVASP
jgi:glycosyltransferase involved in cell wall biosynthesis